MIRIILLLPITWTLFWGCENAPPQTRSTLTPPTEYDCLTPDFFHAKHGENIAKSIEFAQHSRLSATILSLTEDNALDSVTALSARGQLRRQALQYVQRSTLKHFLDFGRFLALTAFAPPNHSPTHSTSSPRNINKRHAQAIFKLIGGRVVNQRRPTANGAWVLDYAVALGIWSNLLSDRFQLKGWWQGIEYQWLMLAQVQGKIPGSEAQLSIARQTLKEVALRHPTCSKRGVSKPLKKRRKADPRPRMSKDRKDSK